MQVGIAPIGIGFIIAVIVLIAAVVFTLIGQLDLKLGLLITGLAVARLT